MKTVIGMFMFASLAVAGVVENPTCPAGQVQYYGLVQVALPNTTGEPTLAGGIEFANQTFTFALEGQTECLDTTQAENNFNDPVIGAGPYNQSYCGTIQDFNGDSDPNFIQSPNNFVLDQGAAVMSVKGVRGAQKARLFVRRRANEPRVSGGIVTSVSLLDNDGSGGSPTCLIKDPSLPASLGQGAYVWAQKVAMCVIEL